MNYSAIRQQARMDMDNNIFSSKWLMLVLGYFLYVTLVSASSAVVVGPFIVTGPLLVGLSSLFLINSRTQDNIQLDNLFRPFKENMGRNVLLGILKSVYIMLWSLLFIVPGIIKSLSYSMSEFIAVDHPEYTASECLDASRDLMNGHKMDLFILNLTFIGWYLLGACVIGFGSYWVQAYMYSARAVFYRQIIGEKNII